MVDRKRDKNYIRKGIRIGPKHIVICDFLDFYAGYKGINKFEFYNSLFNYSLKKIPKDIGYKFIKPPASSYGITRSFFLDKKTYNLLHKTYKESQKLYKTLYDDYLSMGNFTELILYIYVTNNIEKKVLDVFKFDFGIKKIDYIIINETKSIEINNGLKSQKGTSGSSKTVRSIRFQKSEVNCKHTIESSFVMRKRNKKQKYNI